METSYVVSDQPVVIPIVSLSELLTAMSVIRSREDEDRVKIDGLATLSDENVREKLMNWAVAGFPDNYSFHTLQFAILDKCSDGVARPDIFQYIEFLRPAFSLTATLGSLEQKLPGMGLSYSYTKNLTLYIHVSKKQ